ncbi:MAG: hypothetical protein AAFR64_01445 [Pseudomonadota bacterium]
MTTNIKALLWGAIIIAAALLALGFGLSQGAAFGIVSGLSGAAWGSLRSEIGGATTCSFGGLQ